jgi:pyruvate kinase
MEEESPTKYSPDYYNPLLKQERVLVVCQVENDGEIKENKSMNFPALDRYKDLKLSVLGDEDIKILHNCIKQHVSMVTVQCVESKEDITYVRKVLGMQG